MNIIPNYINGKKTTTAKNFFDVYDPSTGEKVSKVVSSDINEGLSISKNRVLFWDFFWSKSLLLDPVLTHDIKVVLITSIEKRMNRV